MNACLQIYLQYSLKLFFTTAEQNAGELVAQLLEMNERARKTEELLEKMEKERLVKHLLDNG